MTIPALPSLDRTSATFKTDLDAFFLTDLPATIPAFNDEIARINSIGFGSYTATSATSLTIGAGSKSLTVDTGKSFGIGQAVVLTSTSSPTMYMNGTVTAHNSSTGALTVNVVDFSGSGTFTAWTINVSAQILRPTKVGDVFQGAVKPTAGTWLALNGSLYLQSTYAELFSLLGILADNPSTVQTATARTLPSSADWYAAAYGNGVFVAVASGGTAAASSTDGITWTARTLPSSANWRSVAYGNGTFVAVASGGSIAATSPDGITWTARTTPTANWLSITFGGSLFYAVGNSSTIAATSHDGVNWTARTLPSSASWYGTTYGNGVFVTVSIGPSTAAASAGPITTYNTSTQFYVPAATATPGINQWIRAL